ncbi:MAG: Gldg family protein [bacterium]
MKNEKIMNAMIILGIILLTMAGIIAFLKGQFDLIAIIFGILGLIAAGVYVTMNIAKVEEIIKSKSARHGFLSLLYTIIVIVIIVLVQFIFTRYSKSFDLTKAQNNTISAQTIKVLDNMEKDIDVYYFYSVRSRVIQIEDMLALYQKEMPKFRFQAIDADRNLTLVAKFKVDSYGVIVLFRPDSGTQEKVDTLTETAVTNALIRLTRNSKKKIYFTTGHGEQSIEGPKNEKFGYSALKEMLETYNYEVSSLQLFMQTAVPKDCYILAIAGPQTDFFGAEVKQIDNYLSTGGRVIFMDAPLVSNKNINYLLLERGVMAHNDIIVDKIGSMFGGDPLVPIISTYDNHEITNTLKQASSMPNTRTFDLKGGVAGINISSLAKSNPGSWGETDITSVKAGSVSQGKYDLLSPLSVAVVISQDNTTYAVDAQALTNCSTGIMAVFGSADFANNTFLGLSGNKDFVINAFNFLAGESDTIAIKPKDNSYEPLSLTIMQGKMLFFIPSVFLPLLIALIGFVVFIRRKIS